MPSLLLQSQPNQNCSLPASISSPSLPSPTPLYYPSIQSPNSPVGQPGPLQIWLRQRLVKMPFVAPMAQTLTRSASIPAAEPQLRRPARPPELAPGDEPLWEIFADLDTNGDAGIDAVELRAALQKLGLPCSPNFVAVMMASEFQNAPNGTTGSSTTGSGTTGRGTTGSSTTGSSTAGSGTAGSGTTGRGTTGSSTTGSGMTGSGTAGSGTYRGASSHAISWEQFRHFVHRREAQIESAFRDLDSSGSRVILSSDLGRALTVAGLPSTARDMKKVMSMMGKRPNETISYEEFRRLVCLMPGFKPGGRGFQVYAEWLQYNNDAPAQPSTRRQPDPVRQYMYFDTFLRASMAASLALIFSMIIRMVL